MLTIDQDGIVKITPEDTLGRYYSYAARYSVYTGAHISVGKARVRPNRILYAVPGSPECYIREYMYLPTNRQQKLPVFITDNRERAQIKSDKIIDPQPIFVYQYYAPINGWLVCGTNAYCFLTDEYYELLNPEEMIREETKRKEELLSVGIK